MRSEEGFMRLNILPLSPSIPDLILALLLAAALIIPWCIDRAVRKYIIKEAP